MIEVDREVSHCVKNMKAVVSTNLKNKQKMPTVILRGADNIKSKYDKLLKVSTLNVCIECSVFRILLCTCFALSYLYGFLNTTAIQPIPAVVGDSLGAHSHHVLTSMSFRVGSSPILLRMHETLNFENGIFIARKISD